MLALDCEVILVKRTILHCLEPRSVLMVMNSMTIIVMLSSY